MSIPRKYRWLRLLALSTGIVLIGVVAFFGYIMSVTPMVSTPQIGPLGSAQSSTDQQSSASTTIGTSTSTRTPPLQTLPPSTPPQNPIVVIPPIASGTLNYAFGMSVGQTLLVASPQQIATELDDMVSLHIGWLRFDIDWSSVQPNNSSQFHWYGIDQLVAAANARNIKLLPIIDYTPGWARPSTCNWTERCAPADPTQYAAFAQAVVQRYAPQGISAWEIWNEPNLQSSWQPAANATAYTQLLEDAYVAIKNIEPSSTIITGGMGPGSTNGHDISPVSFLSQIYTDGGEGYFDAVGMHPYSFPATPNNFQYWNAWSQMASTNHSLRSVMIANGDTSKKIWMTEYGAPTGGPGVLETSDSDTTFAGSPDHVTEALQAEMISQAMTDVQTYSWAGPLLIYSYQDLGTSTNTNENFFGVIRYDGSTKPAYQVIKTLTSE